MPSIVVLALGYSTFVVESFSSTLQEVAAAPVVHDSGCVVEENLAVFPVLIMLGRKKANNKIAKIKLKATCPILKKYINFPVIYSYLVLVYI
tara:strand:- start:616 stop:891 length:276 start_codon:yes stop_codon:yes gene_type:complete